jgi:hypothetical protein
VVAPSERRVDFVEFKSGGLHEKHVVVTCYPECLNKIKDESVVAIL